MKNLIIKVRGKNRKAVAIALLQTAEAILLGVDAGGEDGSGGNSTQCFWSLQKN